MKSREKTIQKSDHLLKAISIADKILRNSKSIDSEILNATLRQGIVVEEEIAKLVNTNQLKANNLKSLTNSFLKYWNENFNIESEIFWDEIKSRNILLERKENLNLVLNKGKFLNLNHAIQIRENWNEVKESGFLQQRFSVEDIEDIEASIKNYEEMKFVFLLFRLDKKMLDSNLHSYFKECVFYLKHFNLFDEYFDIEKQSEIERHLKSLNENGI